MPRPTLSNLINRARRLLNDPESNSIFSDDDIAENLDFRRFDVYGAEVEVMPDSLTVKSNILFWEDGAVVKDNNGNTLDQADSEPLLGNWTLAAQTKESAVYVSGRYFDVYGAAADLLEEWMSREKLNFNVSDGGQMLDREKKFDRLSALADRYRRQQITFSVPMSRSDLNNG